jgi:hypothetical protein
MFRATRFYLCQNARATLAYTLLGANGPKDPVANDFWILLAKRELA